MRHAGFFNIVMSVLMMVIKHWRMKVADVVIANLKIMTTLTVKLTAAIQERKTNTGRKCSKLLLLCFPERTERCNPNFKDEN